MKRVARVRLMLECGHVVELAPTTRLILRAYRRQCPTCETRVDSSDPPRTIPEHYATKEIAPCVCCGAPHVEGAVLPNWCDDCNACDPEGVWGDDRQPTFAYSCPRVQRGEVQASR